MTATDWSASHVSLSANGGHCEQMTPARQKGRLAVQSFEHHLMQHFARLSQKRLRQQQHAPQAHGLDVLFSTDLNIA
jgi:hypothetical protein